VIGLALALSLLAPLSFSQPSGETGKSAIELGAEGQQLFLERKWQEAYERFAAAETRAHSPVFVLHMARCRREQGALLEALRLYQKTADEPVPGDAPEPWHKAKADAATERRLLAARVPRLKIVLRGDASGVGITVDGAPSHHDQPLLVDPGEHRVTAERGGATVASREVDARLDGGEVLVELDVSTPRPPPPPQPGEAEEPSSDLVVAGAIVVALGGAGLIAGAVTGALALSRSNAALERCPDNTCASNDDRSIAEADQADATTLAHVSTATLAVGGALAITGTVLLVLGLGAEEERGMRLGPRVVAVPFATPRAAGIGIDGRF
jgi:hypothetical protein